MMLRLTVLSSIRALTRRTQAPSSHKVAQNHVNGEMGRRAKSGQEMEISKSRCASSQQYIQNILQLLLLGAEQLLDKAWQRSAVTGKCFHTMVGEGGYKTSSRWSGD